MLVAAQWDPDEKCLSFMQCQYAGLHTPYKKTTCDTA